MPPAINIRAWEREERGVVLADVVVVVLVLLLLLMLLLMLVVVVVVVRVDMFANTSWHLNLLVCQGILDVDL